MAYGMLIDLKKCVGCHACAVACKEAHGTPPGITRSHVKREFEGEYPDATMHIVPMLCMHCENPPCVEACPTEGATYKREDGIVVVDQGRCIGCRYCHEACPFGTPHYTPQGMDKCDCCLGAGVEPGREPYCVQACPADALHFGELEEMRPQAEAAGATDLLEAPTGPSFFLT